MHLPTHFYSLRSYRTVAHVLTTNNLDNKKLPQSMDEKTEAIFVAVPAKRAQGQGASAEKAMEAFYAELRWQQKR